MQVLEMHAAREMENHLKRLVQAHRLIKDEPLLLAVHYVPARPGNDIFLFEIAEKFGLNTVDTARTMFEVSYGPEPDFPLAPDQELRLLLTNPTEWAVAIEKNWPAVKKLREADRKERTKVLYSNPKGAKLWSLIRA